MDSVTSLEDLIAIGTKIVEMCDRLKVAHAVAPGSVASWALEVDDQRFAISMSVAGK